MTYVTRGKIDTYDPSGRDITYNLAFDKRPLQRDETLESVGVEDGGILTLLPEMSADPVIPGLKLKKSLKGHQGTITQITWSPDAKILAAISENTGTTLIYLVTVSGFYAATRFGAAGRAKGIANG